MSAELLERLRDGIVLLNGKDCAYDLETTESCMSEAADTIASLSARVAELERERDEAIVRAAKQEDRADAAEARLVKAVEALSEGLDLCARARRMAAMDVERTEMYLRNPDMTRSATVPLWAEEQYQRDLVAWEEKARVFARAAIRARAALEGE